MRKYFNVNGTCYPEKHYMVDLGSHLKEIRILVDRRDYFVINRAHQYGKTTLLRALADYLMDNYGILSLNFQALSTADFANEFAFVAAFADEIVRAAESTDLAASIFDRDALNTLKRIGRNDKELVNLRELFNDLMVLCAAYSSHPLVLITD